MVEKAYNLESKTFIGKRGNSEDRVDGSLDLPLKLPLYHNNPSKYPPLQIYCIYPTRNKNNCDMAKHLPHRGELDRRTFHH